MIDVSNRVLTNVKIYIADVCDNVINGRSNSSPDYPAVNVTQIDSPDIANVMSNTEQGINSVVQIKCGSIESVNEAREILKKACDAMRIMGYKRTYFGETTNDYEPNLFSMSARFERKVCVNDVIERFESK